MTARIDGPADETRSVTLSLTVTFGPGGFEQDYVLADAEGIVARGTTSSFLLYAFHLEKFEPGLLRKMALAAIPDAHNALRDEYFRRYGDERRVARSARANINTVNLGELGLL
jgi:hypothetical protein